MKKRITIGGFTSQEAEPRLLANLSPGLCTSRIRRLARLTAKNMAIGFVIGFALTVSVPNAHAECKSVNGHLISEGSTDFDGTVDDFTVDPPDPPCPNVVLNFDGVPAGEGEPSCGQGRFTGQIEGESFQKQEEFLVRTDTDPPLFPTLRAVFSIQRVRVRTKEGDLLFIANNAFRFPPEFFPQDNSPLPEGEGPVGSVLYITGGTGIWEGAQGHLAYSGILPGACTPDRCHYTGVVCFNSD